MLKRRREGRFWGIFRSDSAYFHCEGAVRIPRIIVQLEAGGIIALMVFEITLSAPKIGPLGRSWVLS